MIRDLRSSAESSDELRRRYEESRLLTYKPCCRAHSKRVPLPNNKEQLQVFCPSNPCPDSIHAKFHMSSKRIKAVWGGNKCISGDTLIEDPLLGVVRKVKDIKEHFCVWSWDGKKLVPAVAGIPFIKGTDDLYELKLRNGSSITCTKAHRIFDGRNYRPVGDLAVGDFAASPRVPEESTVGTVHSIPFSGDRRYVQRVLNFLFGYPAYSRSCDVRLPLVLNTGAVFSPLQAYALGHTGRAFWHKGDLACRLGHIHSCRLSDRLSILGNVLDPILARFFDTLSRIFYRPCKSALNSRPGFLRSIPEFFLRQSNAEFDQRANQCAIDASFGSPLSEVISITYKGKQAYYDFEVPNYHNYYAGGMIHHNSGKTYTGIAELLMCAALKRHPFRKTENPVGGRYRVYSEDFKLVEKFILPKIKEMIPKESLLFDGKTKSEGWTKSYDYKYHILSLKRDVLIDFMTYEQDEAKSESVDLDGVMADEEIPEDVYGAVMPRLIVKNGWFFMTVTPLYGLSWAMSLLESENPEVETFRWEIYDNPHLESKVVKDFESSVLEHERESRLYGRFLEFEGLVYREARPEIHLIEPDKVLKPYPVIFCIDPHPRKASVMAWAYVTQANDVVFFDELEVGGTARDIAYAIRRRENQHRGRTMLRLIDPAARAQASSLGYETDTLREFAKEGMNFSLADNSEAGYNVVHEYLSYNSALPLSALNRPKVFFTKNCQKIWYSLTHLMWDEWTFKRQLRDKKERVKDYKKDGADVVRYVLASRPTYMNFSNVRPVKIQLKGYGAKKIGQQASLII